MPSLYISNNFDGNVFEVQINSGSIQYIYNGTILNSTATLTQSVGVVSTTFTANATDQTILIGTSGIGAIIVSSISTQQVSGLTVASLSDGQVICDLYEDEDIPLLPIMQMLQQEPVPQPELPAGSLLAHTRIWKTEQVLIDPAVIHNVYTQPTRLSWLHNRDPTFQKIEFNYFQLLFLVLSV